MFGYFHVEGMDLAGKTTATKALLEHLGSDTEIRRNSLNPKIVDQLRVKDLIDAADLGLLYLKVLEDDIRNFVKPEKNIIQDSTILLRSLSYHITMGNEDIVEGLLKLIEIHPKFTKSVLLTASIEKRQERLLQRQKDNPEEVAPDDLLVVEKPNLFMEMEANLIKYSTTYFNSLVIDTTQLSKKEVALAVTQEMAI